MSANTRYSPVSCPCLESDAVEEDFRWLVLTNFAFHSACNGFMWMDYSTVSESASEAIGVKVVDINTLYSMSFMAAVPSIVCAMCFLDTYDWGTMLTGTSATVICAWLRWAAVWQQSYPLALASSAALGIGVSVVFTGFAKIPAQWFSRGEERSLASAIAVQSNFFGWALGGIMVPALVGSPHGLRSLLLMQAVIVSLCLPIFFSCHRARRPELTRQNSPVEVPSGESEIEMQKVETIKRIRRGSVAEIASDPETRKAAFGYMANYEFAMHGLACALLQAVGFTIPGVQETIFGSEGYSAKTASWTGFAFIISGVVTGMSLGKCAPASSAPTASYKIVLVLFWACAIAICMLQAVYFYGEGLGSLGRYYVYLPLMGVVGASSLGFLNVHLPIACHTAEPVSEGLSGGLVELLGQVISSALTTLSSGHQFCVCAGAAVLAAILVTIARPIDRHET